MKKDSFYQKIYCLPKLLFILMYDVHIYNDDIIGIPGVKSPSSSMYADLVATSSPKTTSILSSLNEDLLEILRCRMPNIKSSKEKLSLDNEYMHPVLRSCY